MTRLVKFLPVMALLSLAATIGAAQLNVSVTNTGIVVGQTKELVVSAGVNGIISGAAAFGTTVILPACAAALATSFADLTAYSVNWGASLKSDADYEVFFCLGNIGTSAGTVHVSTTGQATGESEIFEQAQAGLVGGLSFSQCDGASIAGGGVIAVREHLHTPSAGLNGQVSLKGQTAFTFS